MAKKITVINGDGIGPSIVESALKILTKAGCDFDFEFVDAGMIALEKHGSLLPSATTASIEKNKVVLKGPLTTPIGEGFSSINVALRKLYGLYANVRPVISFKGTKARYDNIDIVTVRENTQGLYAGVGQTLSNDRNVGVATSLITRDSSYKLLMFAYQLARREKRKSVTIVHKANILKTTSGLFLEVGRDVAKLFPDITTHEMIVDNAAMQLVMNPERFDVIATTNLFGDILSDLCAGLVGGLGMAPGANIGEKFAIFEAVHGSAPDIAGKDIANPSSVILASIQMLQYLQMPEQADRIMYALKETIACGDRTTRDLGGHHGTRDFTQAVISRL